MHMVHLSGNTSGVSKSLPDWLDYTGFLGDVRVAFFNIPPGNKDAVMPNPLTKAVLFTTVTANAYQGELNTGFSKVCEIFSVRGIESLKYIREFHTLCYCGNISHAPKQDAERNELWLVVWHVGQTASWAGLDHWRLSSIPDLQPSVWRSGYERLQ